MSRRRDPGWRDRASADLLSDYLSRLDVSPPVLVMEDPFSEGLNPPANAVTRWNRRAHGGRVATPWPPPGPFQTATLRLPKAKDELLMSLHAAASALQPGGQVLVYGANDEGVQSALDPLGRLFPGAETVAVGGRCRVLQGVRGKEVPGLKASLEEWKESRVLDYPGLEGSWVSYPGIFAGGRLDPGTRLLLGALPPLPRGSRVLDYGCGSGVVAAAASRKTQELVLEMVDVDAVALEAARENVPGGRAVLRDGLPPAEGGAFDFILSNPPFHRGKAEDPGLITDMISRVAPLLRGKGTLIFVAQKRLPLEAELRKHFKEPTTLAEDRTFRVWQGRRPRKGVV